MPDNISSRISFEVYQIDHLLESYADLIEGAKKVTPDLIQMTALASVIHSLYNGIENIFLTIAKELDETVPTGVQWHRDLLLQMTMQTHKRDRVISDDAAERLADYLAFRHFYRHAYSFYLEWDELGKLVMPMKEVWEETKKEIKLFLSKLEISAK